MQDIMELLSKNLSFACLWGRQQLVVELLKDGADVNPKSGGMSLLIAAVFSGRDLLVQSLLDHGASPDNLSAPEPGFLDAGSKFNVEELDSRYGYLTQDTIDMFWRLIWRYGGAGAFGITPLAAATQSNQVGIAHLIRKRGLTENTAALAVRRAFPGCTADTTPSSKVREIILRNLDSFKDPQALGQKISLEAVGDGPLEVL